MIFNNNGNVFEQIAENYIKMIKSGAIKEGEYLPSCRDLAKNLGINPNTVQRAYTLLEEKGYVTKVLKKGVYVSYSNDNKIIDELKNEIIKYKENGISKEEILSLIDKVYDGGLDDKD
ncbi:MAG: GntR family transcriptional regulator [Acholeplasmatales bacterium]|jgi:GntR family transcriptional regulator|nr:GntR family transcriptional regulator [Acholeplasmatales bacterium]MBR6287905.1 GntR family transcriptional regulator [Acholeplasmatales bacterium]